MVSRKQDSGYSRIFRKEMRRGIELVTDLDYGTPYSRSAQAHAVAHRAFVDWKAVSAVVVVVGSS